MRINRDPHSISEVSNLVQIGHLCFRMHQNLYRKQESLLIQDLVMNNV